MNTLFIYESYPKSIGLVILRYTRAPAIWASAFGRRIWTGISTFIGRTPTRRHWQGKRLVL